MKRNFACMILFSILVLPGAFTSAQDFPADANVIFFTSGNVRDTELYDQVRKIFVSAGYSIKMQDRDNLQFTALPGQGNQDVRDVRKLVVNVSGFSMAIRTFFKDDASGKSWTRVVNSGAKNSLQKHLWENSLRIVQKVQDRIGGDFATRAEPLKNPSGYAPGQELY